jgi:hypothetical protein
VTTALLRRPEIERKDENEAEWFDLARPSTSVEQLVLDRESGITAVREVLLGYQPHQAASLDDVWADWFDEALSEGRHDAAGGDPNWIGEPAHISEFRLVLSRSYLGGGAMRLRRTGR